MLRIEVRDKHSVDEIYAFNIYRA